VILPLISIITPSFNQGKYIEQNILSVLNQNYTNFEHIIIDGGSTDNTLEILKKYPHLKWISEPDEGQADALNKGLKLATGEIIGWINSDDYYLEGVFNEIIKIFEIPEAQWVIGNIGMLFQDFNKEIRTKTPYISYDSLIKNPDIVRQQSTFYKKELLQKAGFFDKNLQFVMDYEMWLRLIKIAKPIMVDRYWAVFRMHSTQKTLPKNILLQFKEIDNVLKNERIGYLKRKRIGINKYIIYFKQLIKKCLISLHIINEKDYGIPYRLRVKW